MLRRWPAILAAVAAGAFLLGVTAASPELFLSSTATDALGRSVGESTRFGAGITVALHDSRRDELAGEAGRISTVDARDAVLQEATASIPHLDDRVLSILGDPVPVSSENTRAAEANPVRLVFRTNALDHVGVVEEGGEGVWIQDVTADALRVEPGDALYLSSPRSSRGSRGLEPTGDGRFPVRIAGVYESLANSPPDPFWEPLADFFRPPAIDAPLPPPFVLVGREDIEQLMDRLEQGSADFQWEFPLDPDVALDTGTASGLVDDFTHVATALHDTRSPLGKYFVCTTCQVRTPIRLDVRSTLEDDLGRASETADSLRPSIELLAVAGLLTALVVLGAAGLYAVNRRRTEMRLLAARGVAPAVLGAKTTVECTLPVVVGAASGLVASALLLERFGPGAALDRASLVDATRATAVVVPVALVVIGVVSGLSALRFSPRATSPRRGWMVWEIPVLLAAGFALRQIVSGNGLVSEGASGVDRVSSWLLVFPVLFVSAGGGLAARAFRRLLAALRAPRLRVGPALYLALNRLATAGWLAVMLITASSLAFGVYLYAQTMAASVQETTSAKSHVFTGSDVAVSVDRQYEAPRSFPWPHTSVSSKLDAGRLQPSNETFDMLAVDVATFERAAFWDDSFYEGSLGSLMRELGSPAPGSDVLRVVVAGSLPSGSTIEMGGVPIPYDVAARVDAFPGQFLDRTLLVVDKAGAGEVIEEAGGLDPVTAAGAAGSLWIKGNTDGILDSLGDLGFGPDDALTASAVLQNPSFVAVSRTFGFFESLGALAAMLVLVGIVLYVQTRQRARSVSYALARRMGLRSRSHYAALVVELAGMLTLSLFVGAALGAAAARLVYARVDLLPNIPPNPLLRVPFDAALPVAAALALTAFLGAWRAHRSAEKADIAEALRSGA